MGEPETSPALGPVQLRRARRLARLADTSRHLPISFAIVGAQKAATSTLYRRLVRHPHVVAGPEKEMRFFLEDWRDWQNPDYTDYVRPAMSARARIAGDATPDYIVWPGALARMAAYRPEMKIILSVRDPIERAVSQWSMERDRNPRFPEFADAVGRWATPTIPANVPEGTGISKFLRETIFARGLYGQQIRNGLESFPADQWLIVDFHDVTREGDQVMDRITDFLGLDRFDSHPPAIHRNQTRVDHGVAPVPAQVIERLVALYAEDLDLLQQQSGLSLGHWPTVRAARGELPAADFAARVSAKIGAR